MSKDEVSSEESPLLNSPDDKYHKVEWSSSFRGKVLVTTATIMFALNVTMSRWFYERDLSVSLVQMIYSIWQFVFMGLFMKIYGTKFMPTPRMRFPLMQSCFFIGGMNLLWLFAINFANPGNCASFMGVLPLFSAGFAYVFLGDTVNVCVFSITATLCLVGVVMIVKPPFLFANTPTSGKEIFGYFLMFFAVICYASLTLVQRIHKTNGQRTVFWSSTFLIFVYAIFKLVDEPWIHVTFSQHLLLAFLGLTKVYCYWGVTEGCIYLPPALSGLLFLIEIPATYILETLLIGIVCDYLTYAGVFVILFAIAYYIQKEEVIEDFDGELQKGGVMTAI